ncbi:MAG: hypothetical protein AVDCRST_MAG03-3691, partial [uncultured Rubrobacteraceae bacterium]
DGRYHGDQAAGAGLHRRLRRGLADDGGHGLGAGGEDGAPRTNPERHPFLALPYKRHNRELRRMAPNSPRIGKERFAKYQFSDPYV